MSKQITIKWWEKCLNDPEKLEHWLVALYNNEKDAEERFVSFANDYCKPGSEEYNHFMNIAREEGNHAKIVDNLLSELCIQKYEKSSKNGRYFRNTIPCVVDRKTAAAIGAHAETLSLNRMRVIINYPGTPVKIKEMFEVIEPEERGHVKILSKIATKYGMDAVKDCHEKGLIELGLKIKENT